MKIKSKKEMRKNKANIKKKKKKNKQKREALENLLHSIGTFFECNCS